MECVADPVAPEPEPGGLLEELRHLPDRDREVLLLRYYKGLTQTNTARVLGVSQVQISRLERRAVDRLRQVLLPP